jgi:hypothetical protein
MAVRGAPTLLDELIEIHRLACRERGELVDEEPVSSSESERKQMLSAIRATVYRSRARSTCASRD